jgi:hypothetical protein
MSQSTSQCQCLHLHLRSPLLSAGGGGGGGNPHRRRYHLGLPANKLQNATAAELVTATAHGDPETNYFHSAEDPNPNSTP